MNTQNNYGNEMDSALVKYKDTTQPMKQPKIPKKINSEESEPQYHFQGQCTRPQHWFDLDPE